LRPPALSSSRRASALQCAACAARDERVAARGAGGDEERGGVDTVSGDDAIAPSWAAFARGRRAAIGVSLRAAGSEDGGERLVELAATADARRVTEMDRGRQAVEIKG